MREGGGCSTKRVRVGLLLDPCGLADARGGEAALQVAHRHLLSLCHARAAGRLQERGAELEKAAALGRWVGMEEKPLPRHP